MTRMKSNSFSVFNYFVLGFVVVGLLNISTAMAQTRSIVGETHRGVESNTLVDDTEAGKARSVTACAASRLAMETAGTCLICDCCPDSNSDEVCSDKSCNACRSSCLQSSAEVPLACSFDVLATDSIPPHADCPTMDTMVASNQNSMNDPPEPMVSSLSMNQYCADMAELLASSITSPDVDEHSCKFAIEAALKMAVRNTELKMDTRFEKMKARYANELLSYRNIVSQSSTAMQSNKQVQQWMAPIYQNLDRNYQQMRLMQATHVNMDRTLELLEQFAQETLDERNPPRQRITLRSPERKLPLSAASLPQQVSYRAQQASPMPKQDAEVARLRRQVQLLEAQLYSMNLRQVEQQQQMEKSELAQQHMEQQRVARAYRQAGYDMNSNVRQTSAEQSVVDGYSPLRPVEAQYRSMQPLLPPTSGTLRR